LQSCIAIAIEAEMWVSQFLNLIIKSEKVYTYTKKCII